MTEQRPDARENQAVDQSGDSISLVDSLNNLKQDKQLDSVLLELFCFYARKYAQKAPDFSQIHHYYKNISLKGYVAFCKDFKVQIDQSRLTQVWNKSSNQLMGFQDFRQSLPKLAIGQNLFLIQNLKRKINAIKLGLALQEKDQQTRKDKLLNDFATVSTELKQLESRTDRNTIEQFIKDVFPFQDILQYRILMKGYLEDKNLVKANLQIVKLLQEDKQNDGISSSIGTQSLSQQKISVERLYQRIPSVSKSKTKNPDQYAEGERRSQLRAKLREQRLKKIQDLELSQAENLHNMESMSNEQIQKGKQIGQFQIRELGQGLDQVYDPNSFIIYDPEFELGMQQIKLMIDESPRNIRVQPEKNYDYKNYANKLFESPLPQTIVDRQHKTDLVSKSVPSLSHYFQQKTLIDQQMISPVALRNLGVNQYGDNEPPLIQSHPQSITRTITNKTSQRVAKRRTALQLQQINTSLQYGDYSASELHSMIKRGQQNEGVELVERKKFQIHNVQNTPQPLGLHQKVISQIESRRIPQQKVNQLRIRMETTDQAIARLSKADLINQQRKQLKMQSILNGQKSKQFQQLQVIKQQPSLIQLNKYSKN